MSSPETIQNSVPSATDQTPEKIRGMFGQITPSYDRLNHLFSGMMDHYWRWSAARKIGGGLTPCRRILDVATGTGDLARALARRVPEAKITGLDFTRSMLDIAVKKYGFESHRWIEGDGLKLPFANGSFDACSIAFGLRNMSDRAAGLREMRRIVRTGGRVGVLEFSQPRNALMRGFYDFYSLKLMPRLGKAISGSDAYLYLPTSIRAFWNPEELADQMRLAGLTNVRHHLFTGGVVALHIGEAQ